MDASPASELLRNFVSFNRAHPAKKATPSLRIMIVDSNQVAATKVHSLLLSERGDCDDEIKRVNHGLEALVVAEQFQTRAGDHARGLSAPQRGLHSETFEKTTVGQSASYRLACVQ